MASGSCIRRSFAAALWPPASFRPAAAAGEPSRRLLVSGSAIRGIAIGNAFVATEADGHARAYFSPRHASRYVSAVDVLQGRADPAQLAQKLVLIAVTGVGLGDYYATPVGERMPGSEIHAQLIENLYEGTLLERPAWAPFVEAAGFALTDLSRAPALDGVAALIVSPGIPHLYPRPHPVIARALDRGVPVDNDIGLFFRSFATGDWDGFDLEPRVVCVTGSNGKSTTTALIHHILHEAGRPAQMAGNIGRGVLDIDPARDGEVIVLELSSYQTELARALTPDIAVFTNLSPDHLDRHGGMGGYFAAKRRLFALTGAYYQDPFLLEMAEQSHFGTPTPLDRVLRLLLEPTETESKEELDGFVAAMIAIRHVAETEPEKLKGAPWTLPVRRLDDVRAAKQLDLTWKAA
jgi:hypothetical protein